MDDKTHVNTRILVNLMTDSTNQFSQLISGIVVDISDLYI